MFSIRSQQGPECYVVDCYGTQCGQRASAFVPAESADRNEQRPHQNDQCAHIAQYDRQCTRTASYTDRDGISRSVCRGIGTLHNDGFSCVSASPHACRALQLPQALDEVMVT